MAAMAPSMRALCIAAVSCAVGATSPQALLQRLSGSQDLSVLEARSPMPKTYTLRLCNAYAWSAPLEMRRLQEPKLVEYPLPYKECHDYTLPLSDGDELQFRAGDLNIGTFIVKGLPRHPSMLLLVPHKKSAESMAVVFDSHMYSEGDYPQVALVDAYVGSAPASLLLKEMHKSDPPQAMRFRSVITLTPGEYEVTLGNNVTTGAANTISLRAVQKERYVVVRVGTGANGTDGLYNEDMLVFPRTSSSDAFRAFGSATALLCVVLSALRP